MQIKFLVSTAGMDFSYSEGQEVEVPDELAQQFVDCGHAEVVQEQPQPKKRKNERA